MFSYKKLDVYNEAEEYYEALMPSNRPWFGSGSSFAVGSAED